MTASTPRDVERMLRSQGYSRKAAKTAVAGMKTQGVFKQKPNVNLLTRIFNAIKGA